METCASHQFLCILVQFKKTVLTAPVGGARERELNATRNRKMKNKDRGATSNTCKCTHFHATDLAKRKTNFMASLVCENMGNPNHVCTTTSSASTERNLLTCRLHGPSAQSNGPAHVCH